MCGRMPGARHLRGAGPSTGIRERRRVQLGSGQAAEGFGRAGNHSPQGSPGHRPRAKKGPGLLSDQPALGILHRYNQIDATDTQIDRLVYELYELTPDEIKIVE